MNRSLIKHELAIMSKSKKNVLFVMFLTVLLFSYCFMILPNKQTTESFDPEEMSQALKEVSAQQRDREARGATGFPPFIGMPVYAYYEHYYQLHSKMLTAFEDKDLTRFAHLRAHYLEGNMYSITSDESLFVQSTFPGKDRTHLYYQTLMNYQAYFNKDSPISYAMIEQKTALQTLQNMFLSPVTYLILFCAIYFSCDILTRDRYNRTVLQGFPLPWYRMLNIKTFVTFIYTLIVLLVLMIVGIIILSLQNGFGFFNIQVPVMIGQEDFTLNDYDFMSYGLFILKVISFIPILVYLFIRLNIVFGLLLKNEWLVLMVSIIVLFSERIYFSRRLRELFGIEISNFPQTYFEFGKVVSGDKNFLVNLQTITYAKGFFVLIVTVVIIELTLFLSSRIVNKRRFYQKN